MADIPLHWQSITTLSEQIQQGSLSPVELMEHLLDRVEELDETLHAFRLVPRELDLLLHKFIHAATSATNLLLVWLGIEICSDNRAANSTA